MWRLTNFTNKAVHCTKENIPRNCAMSYVTAFRSMPMSTGADPEFLPGEGAKGLMTLYGIGMSDF